MLINFHEAIHLDYSDESGPSALLEKISQTRTHKTDISALQLRAIIKYALK